MRFAAAVGMVQLFGTPGPAGGPRCSRRSLWRTALGAVVSRAGLPPTPHRRDREVRPRHVLPERRRGARDAGRGNGCSCPPPGWRPTTSSPRCRLRRSPTAVVAAVAGGPLRPDRRELRQPGHGGPHRRPDGGDGGGRRRGPLPRPARGMRSRLAGGALLITADHGNAEKMQDGETPHTAHTHGSVPAVLAGAPGLALRGRRARRYRADGARP